MWSLTISGMDSHMVSFTFWIAPHLDLIVFKNALRSGPPLYYYKTRQRLYSSIGKHELNRRNKLILEIELSKGFAPTRLIISIFHRLIGQYFESGILFISLANQHGGKDD